MSSEQRQVVGSARRALIAAAAAGALARPSFAQSTLRLTLVTGGTGGVAFAFGGGLARVLTEHVPNLRATAQVTGGSLDNVKLVSAGEGDIGFASLDSAADGFKGEGPYARDGRQNIRTLAVIFGNFVHVVASVPSGITNVAQMRGKRIGVGTAGSATETLADRVMRAAGLDPQRDIRRDNLSATESVNSLKDGKIGAFFFLSGVPSAAIRELTISNQPPVVFVPTGEEQSKLADQYPGLYTAVTLPQDAYPGMAGAVPGIGAPNIMIVSPRMPDRVVTQILTAMFDNLEEVRRIHPEARNLSLRGSAERVAVPFHPAAEAFYRVRGVL
ncbi:TAXI family TRAP transporter solute-binding subunit [Falsiroseomonas sp. HW251]|uniref:TAXI family TRAP transporter solute-binding subunit n=1 Tax=Falsiroseomonas sp. HW251 TaxID=3390998 RepID=UPI003D318BF1